jgi:hypothetical protein
MTWGLIGIPIVLFVTGYLSGLLMKTIEYAMVKRMGAHHAQTVLFSFGFQSVIPGLS